MTKTDTPHWEHLRSEEGPSMQLFAARFDYLRNPRNGKAVRIVVLDSPDTVNIVAITKERKVVLVNQYRFGTKEMILECPGGIMEAGETSQESAARELMEETGYTGSEWHYLGSIPSNPVFQNNYVHHWLVTDAERTTAQVLDEEEDVEVLEVPLADIQAMLRTGQIAHPHAISALIRLPDVWK